MSIVQDIRLAFSRRDNALVKIIWLNVLVFVGVVLLEAFVYLSQSPGIMLRVMNQLELSANLGVVARHPWTVLTYAFTHQGFLHILFNMLQLYWFGQLLQEYLGDRRLVSIYVLGALAGAATFLLGYNLIPVLMPAAAAGQLVLGASGAITAVIVAAATLLPNYTFMLILVGPVRIKWIAAVVIIMSVAGLAGNPGGMLAHLGGALLGFLFIKQLQAGRDLGRPVQAVGNWFSNLTSSRPAMRVSSTPRRPETVTASSASGARKPTAPGQPLQDEIDTILDKISRSGYESLSKEEKQKLFRASQQ